MTERCLYSALGRHALHILWDNESPVQEATTDCAVTPPAAQEPMVSPGRVSLQHFRAEMDRLVSVFREVFPEVFNTNGDWIDWILTLYEDTGFLRRARGYVGPVRDRDTAFHGCSFLRGSHLATEGVRMSGLGMYLPSISSGAEPFQNLSLLPPAPRPTPDDGDIPALQTFQNLEAGNLALIRYEKRGDCVRFSVPFRLPKAERRLLQLCSWPPEFSVPTDTGIMENWSMAAPVFKGIQEEMQNLGYRFSGQ